jgi:phosphatidylglycerol:prolipoprotein diacylglycerol transferase
LTDYSMLLGTGAVVSLLRLARVTPRARRNRWLLAGWGILLLSLAGARMGYCLERFPYFARHLLEGFAFWQGGLNWQGAVVGGFAALFLVNRLSKIPFLVLLDTTSVMLLPLAVTAWLGAWTEGVAYGMALPPGTWWGLPSKDVYGQVGLFAPLPLGASLSLLILIGMVETGAVRFKRKGVMGAMIWLIFSLIMLLFTWLRADPSPTWLHLRLETWFGLVLTGVFLVVCLKLTLVKQPDREATVSDSMDRAKDVPL